MSWTYEQSTGKLYDPEGELVAKGYSGMGVGKNNPALQNVVDVGPLPTGIYTICPPEDSPKHGPYAMALVPDPGNNMHNRSGFMLHGDSKQHPGAASEGCVILDAATRHAIWASTDHMLDVIAMDFTLPPTT